MQLVMISLIDAFSDQPVTRDRLCEVAVAFPIVFMLHLWGEPDRRTDTCVRMLDGVLDDATMQMVKRTGH